MKHFLNKIKQKTALRRMYPDLKKAGGLAQALNAELAAIGSDLKAAGKDGGIAIPVVYASVALRNKFSQIYIAAEKRLFMADFWRDGACLANSGSGHLTEIAAAIDFWLNNEVSTTLLAEKYSIVTLNDRAKAYDDNDEVNYRWQWMLSDDDSMGLQPFLKLASEDGDLKKLFPFTSLYTLRLSRCTGYPFDTKDLPSVTAKQYQQFGPAWRTLQETTSREPLFVVTRNNNEYLGEGTAAEALKIVKDNLQYPVLPARKGTADD